jgi:pseudouridine-5'-phosphate glycosidase
MTKSFLRYTPEVHQALLDRRPVVALESTIISHGMPYPQNVEMANKVESIIRAQGAVPATIAILDGEIRIGLEPKDLEFLAQAKDVVKVSRRDLAAVVASKKTGATTVAATMICAKLAGIEFFVTGGIGGVHRGYEETLDVSADLEELGMTEVTVICTGAKSILDLPRTMEYLETKGVPVIGYKTQELPAFFTRSSGVKLEMRMDTPEEVARFLATKGSLGLKGGVLIANPIPEEHQLDRAFIDSVISASIAEAAEKGIAGKEVTPFLLGNIVKRTEGKSLQANLQLVYHNAKVGAQLAVALATLRHQQSL